MWSRTHSHRARGFTLLEMMLALAITALMVFVVYRFVSAHLAVMAASSEIEDERETLNSLVNFIQAQMNGLSPDDDGGIAGKALKFRGLPSDELTWRTAAGPGMLTTAAPGDFFITLAIQPVTERSSDLELGLRRAPVPENKAKLDLKRGGSGGRYDWVPLVRPMAAVEIRYFNSVSHSWTDNWTVGTQRPSVIRVRLWRHAEDTPLEAEIQVPSARLTRT